MKNGNKSNVNNTIKNTVREKRTFSKLKTGKDFKKLTINNISSKNNSITLNKDIIVTDKKKSLSNKPIKQSKRMIDSAKNPLHVNSFKNIDLLKKNDTKRSITKKNITTITITNTKLVPKQQNNHKDSSQKIQSLRVNTSNPNLGSPLTVKLGKRKNLKEELKIREELCIKREDNSHIITEINRYGHKKNELSNNFFNIDELSSKMSSSFLIKTQEIFPKLTNNTFTKEPLTTIHVREKTSKLYINLFRN